MSIKVIGKDSLCGIVAVSVTVNLKHQYSVMVMLDSGRFINADVSTDDLHEILLSEESLEQLFPGIMAMVRAA